VLVVTTLAFLTAFVLAGSTSAHLSFANRSSRVLRARLLAEAAITRAVAELQSNPEFGSLEETLQVSLPGNPGGSEGSLSFHPSQQAFSTYNLDSDTSRPGFGSRIVPAHSVHLVGEGNCLGVRRRVEAIVTLPPYPYAIASSGPIESDGELLVGSLSGQESHGPITAETLYPAHLASNDAVEDSIRLGPQTTIVGDVRSVGGLQLSQGVVVKGQTLAYGQAVALPEIPLESYDPELSQSGYQELPSELTNATIAGTARADGDVTVYGDLTLEQGKLYVEGHLTVRGPIAGQGLIVARDGATIYTGARISGGQAVLLSGGDVLLKGGGPLGSFFQGMVYCEGGFEASDITVVGSFISKGEGAGVKLRNARVLGETSSTSWSPTLSHTFHFVPGERRNEPAVQVAEPSAESFSIQVRILSREDGVAVEVDDPVGGGTRSYTSIQTAARQIAVLANEIGRDMAGAVGRPGNGRNLVAAAETLEAALQRLGEGLGEAAGEGFDLNQFLSISDRLRVTLWREL
jgi:phage baseplate assembly protein gpV